MAKTVEDEGYTIQSRPYYDANWDKWQIRILISCEGPQGIRTREFSSMVLYGTEQEADIHGVTFGQHLIEGKVEGQSVMDMKTPDRRAMPRIPLCRIKSDGPILPLPPNIGHLYDLEMVFNEE